ncbi:MAG: hypothetical protein MZU91_08555 [Desulfosudis oleivorans]|nr:hypothetical protein [Desulfosudis oleivorans]
MLSAAGVAELPVYARPRALVVATGDELVAPGVPLKPGQIYESNRLPTLLQLQALGADVVDGGTVGDDPQALRALFGALGGFRFRRHQRRRLGRRPRSGEAGVRGDRRDRLLAGEDQARQAGRRSGGSASARHFFALPGNPVSSLVTFKLFVEPALIAWHHGRHADWLLPATVVNAFGASPGASSSCARGCGREWRAQGRMPRGPGLAHARPDPARQRLHPRRRGQRRLRHGRGAGGGCAVIDQLQPS